jgi:glutathione S-transferase
MAFGVVGARKKYQVEYPALYATGETAPGLSAEDRAKFNCVQRGHQNSLEMLPSFLALLAAAGVRHPLTASALGASYLAGRIFYFRGYSTGDPKKRVNKGTALMYVGVLGLAITAIKAAGEALLRSSDK